MSIDKRVMARHRKRLQLRYGPDGPDKIGFTEDISATGIFIKTPVVMQPGKVIFVEFMIDGNTRILVRGRIMWAKKVPQSLLRKIKGGMGVHILSFDEGREEYLRLCASLQR